MIFRLLLLFLIVWFLIWLFKKQFSDEPESSTSDSDQESEDMLPCAHCGTHVPKSLGYQQYGKFYCCEEFAEYDQAGDD